MTREKVKYFLLGRALETGVIEITGREISQALGIEKRAADRAVDALIKDGYLEGRIQGD